MSSIREKFLLGGTVVVFVGATFLGTQMLFASTGSDEETETCEKQTVAAGEMVDVDVVGVFALPKVAANNIALGAPVHWDATAGLVTTTAAGKTKLGVATEPAPAQSGTVRVRLSGF